MTLSRAPEGAVKPLPGLVAWAGGKRNLARRLAALIDADPHRCYVEPFMGGGSVFFARGRRRPVEIVNDANGDLVALWRCWQRHPDELLRAIVATPFARAEAERLHRLDPADMTDIERAARLAILQRVRFGARLDKAGFCSSPDSSKAARPEVWRRRIMAAVARLSGVVIERQDFGEILRRYDRPTTLFYLDPPYWGAEHAYGRGCFGAGDFERLAAALGRLKGRFLMSLNDTAEVREIFADFRIETIETVWSSKAVGDRAVTELLISSR